MLGEKALSNLEESHSKLSHGFAPAMTVCVKTIRENLMSDSVKTFFTTLSELFMSCFSGDTEFFLLSKLTEAYLRNVAFVCADKNNRESLLSYLVLYVDIQLPLAQLLLSAVMSEFSKQLLAFIIRVMGKGEGVETCPVEERYAVRSENTDTEEFILNMHFVGGANVKKILRAALRLRNPNERSLRLIYAIRNNFLITSWADAPDDVLMAWTEAQDRGGLLKINKQVLQFFVLLGKLVSPLERLCGSVLVSEVIEKVCGSRDIILLWDDIVKDTLCQEESFELLHELCCHYCVTHRNGVMSRLKDEWAQKRMEQKHGTGGLSFRARMG